jgi:hypothetical protein
MSEVDPKQVSELIERLRTIPHLDLGIWFDPNLLLEEYQTLLDKFEFQGYNSTIPEMKKYYENRWTGISLNSEDGELYTELMVRDENNDCKVFHQTEALKACSYLQHILTVTGGYKYRARILRLAPKSTIGWHCHALEYQKFENMLIVQIPIVMPENFKYSVMNIYDYKFSDFTTFPRIVSKRYPVGSAHIFNSYHYHNIFNHDDETRVTLEFHINIEDKKCYDIVKAAVDKHDGPFI